MKNETNSLYKLEALTSLSKQSTVNNPETEFKIEFRASSKISNKSIENKCKRSKSVNDFSTIKDNEEFQNEENEIIHSIPKKSTTGLVLDSSCLSGLPTDKRRGVKMGIRAFAKFGPRVSRSMEAVNMLTNEDLEQLSLQSVSIHCSSASIPHSPVIDVKPTSNAYIIGKIETAFNAPEVKCIKVERHLIRK